MARTCVEIPCTLPQSQAEQRVREVLAADKYREIDYNGETVWKMGIGMMTAMHYIKTEYLEGMVRVYGWIQMGVGPVGGKEHALSGVVAVIPKKSVLKTIDKIKAAIR